MHPAPLYLYLLVSDKTASPTDMTPASRIGKASDMGRRLALLNADGSGHAWTILLVIVVPRVLSATALAEQWKRDARRVHRRFQYGIDTIARHFGLPFFVNCAELKTSAHMHRTLHAYVQSVLATNPRDVADVAALECEPTTHVLNEQSYARASHPRERYKHRRRPVHVTKRRRGSTRPHSRLSHETLARLERVLLASQPQSVLVASLQTWVPPPPLTDQATTNPAADE